MKFKDIVNEIAWKCKDGMPNFKRDDDVILLLLLLVLFCCKCLPNKSNASEGAF